MTLLPAHIAESLRDPTSALAAAFVIAHHHPEILSWIAETLAPPPAELRPPSKSNGAAHPPAKPNGAAHHSVKSKPKAAGGYLDRRVAQRDLDDEALLEAMRTSPDGVIPDWAESVGKSKSSIVTALHRLQAAGLVENVDRRWSVVAEEPKPPPEKWTAPLSATAHARVHV
jgi:hypothetical protein